MKFFEYLCYNTTDNCNFEYLDIIKNQQIFDNNEY